MNAEMIGRRLKDTLGANRVIISGYCPGDLIAPSTQLGVSVERGPEKVKNLPLYFGRQIKQHDLSQYKPKYSPKWLRPTEKECSDLTHISTHPRIIPENSSHTLTVTDPSWK